jgi:23S rRNA pseudouridine955/2504/2580 synthase
LTQNRSEVRKVRVTANEDGQRIDNFLLKQLPGVPKSHVYRLLRSGQVRVDGGRAKAERKLAEGQEVRIPPVRTAEVGEARRPPDALVNRLRESVIHDDADYLAITKPSGLASHAGSGIDFGVIEVARAWGAHPWLELCHRLDRDTSGVLLLAKNREALLRAQRALKHGTVIKKYFALVVGKWKGEDREVTAALLRDAVVAGERRVRVADDEDGKPAHSRFSPRQRFRDATLMEVQIFSGRTHQIRVHAAALGHPVVGDDKYGERDINRPFRERGLKRMFLHAHLMQLPADGAFDKLLVTSPLPDELRDATHGLPAGGPTRRR